MVAALVQLAGWSRASGSEHKQGKDNLRMVVGSARHLHLLYLFQRLRYDARPPLSPSPQGHPVGLRKQEESCDLHETAEQAFPFMIGLVPCLIPGPSPYWYSKVQDSVPFLACTIPSLPRWAGQRGLFWESW